MEEGEVVKIRIQALSDKIVELERKVKEQRTTIETQGKVILDKSWQIKQYKNALFVSLRGDCSDHDDY